jgi:hypothetical protein
MKKFVEILVLVATWTLGAGSAGAGEMPHNLQGKWCGGPDIYYSSCSKDDNSITIDKDGFHAIENGCRVSNSSIIGRELVVPGRTSPKFNSYVPVYQIIFRCEGEGARWRENWRAYIDRGGILKVTRAQSSVVLEGK